MKKKILCLAMTAIMVVGMSMTTFAEDYQGKDGWLAEFKGSEIDTNFASSDLMDEASNIQPGDSIELKVQIKNSSSDQTDWYMTNEVIQSLEDAKTSASGGGYEYRLTYYNSSNTETVLYDSTTVGGDGTSENGTGLHQATGSLENYFYLDRLNKDQSGSVHLKITVDGETQGNNYQQTLAKLQINFAVEKVAAATTQNVVKNVVQTVKTGDNTRILLLSAIALVSGVVLLVLGFYSLKKRKNSYEEGE
ncbi:MAG: sortase B protein-sorting domain-containing protein [Hespellia sp.]|nr:sortase B protein-sorting domain-containing protein [Hespellia sp.]